jgi:hypothetical protein
MIKLPILAPSKANVPGINPKIAILEIEGESGLGGPFSLLRQSRRTGISSCAHGKQKGYETNLRVTLFV